MKKQTIITIVAIVAILAATVLMGCVEKPAPISNSEFRNISAEAATNIAQQFAMIIVAEDDGDFVTAKTRLATFDASLEQYIAEFKDIEVAENTIPCKNALIRAFEECQRMGVYFDAYLENPTPKAYEQLGAQMDNMSNQMEISAMLVEKLKA